MTLTGLVAVLFGTLATAACGFQLRTWDLATAFETARIDAARGVDLHRDLGQALRSAGVRVVDGDADVVVVLSEQRNDRRSASVTSDARTAEYELSSQVRFAVKDADGTVLTESVLRSERVARLERNRLVGSSEERELLSEEIRSDLVGRMLRTLEVLSKQAAGDDAAMDSETKPESNADTAAEHRAAADKLVSAWSDESRVAWYQRARERVSSALHGETEKPHGAG